MERNDGTDSDRTVAAHMHAHYTHTSLTTALTKYFTSGKLQAYTNSVRQTTSHWKVQFILQGQPSRDALGQLKCCELLHEKLHLKELEIGELP